MKSVQCIHPGITRIRLPMPGRKPGPVNVFLFKGADNVSLIDTGTFMSSWLLKRRLARLGVGFADIDQIVLTHGHLDHQGGVKTIARYRRNQLRVCAHHDEISAIQEGQDAPLRAYSRFLRITGTPLRYRLAIQTMMFWGQRITRACRVNHPLADGDRLKLGDHEVEVVATPGHTRGSISIFLRKEGVLFSGDHILGHITPNALPMFERDAMLPVRQSQKEYYNSLETIARLNPKIIYPAHGAQIDDFDGVHRMYRDCFVRRQEMILSVIRQEPGLSIYMITRQLFPQIQGRAFVLNLFLAVSEIFTHLQVLETEGLAQMEEENGILKIRGR